MLADFSRNYVLKSILRKMMPGGAPSNSIARILRVAHNPIAESHELCLALVEPGPHYTFQIIHGGGRDGARYLPLAVNHRKQHDHPIELVAEKSTTCERHWTKSFPSRPFWLSCSTQHVQPLGGRGSMDLPTTRQITLAISISFCPQRRSAAIPHPFGSVLRQ
jgi:hypothetical protein